MMPATANTRYAGPKAEAIPGAEGMGSVAGTKSRPVPQTR